LHREQDKNFKASLLKAIAPEGNGLFGVKVEMGRIHMVIRRVVQCLYAHETGRRLPDTHESRVASTEVLSQFEQEKREEFRKLFVARLIEHKWNIVAGNQFAYAVIHTERPFVPVWGMTFYGSLPFVGFTGRKTQ
jgi:hypothetical protein